MFYKLSNLATIDSIESKFHVSFEYPNLYRSEIIIEGNKESLLPVITASEPKKVTYAIWGLLPENFEDNWSVFQDAFNTLNVEFETLEKKSGLFSGMLEQKRCAILVTGFFTSLLTRGTIEPCYVHLPNYEPFAIAGVYNELNDGFITCSMVVIPASKSFREVPDVSNLKPLILKNGEMKRWLDPSSKIEEISELGAGNMTMDFDYEFNQDLNSMLKRISE